MLKFNYVEAKNFLSVGNTIVRLEYKQGINLVLGKNFQELSEDGLPISNGAGKSLMTVEALLFCLFGKTFRKIKKGSYVNKINKKNCVVRVSVHKNDVHYLIERGITPTFLKFKRNNEDWIEMSSIKLTQELLEQELNISYQSFTNRIVFNITKYQSFFNKPAAEKRKVLEDLMNMGFYGDIFEVKKKLYNEAFMKYKNIKAVIEHEEERNKEFKAKNEIIKLDREEWERNQQKKIKMELDKLNDANILLQTAKNKAEIENYNEIVSSIKTKTKLVTELSMVRDKYIAFISDLKNNIAELEKIDYVNIDDQISSYTNELNMLFATMTNEEYQDALDNLENTLVFTNTDISTLITKISECATEINTIDSVIKQFENGICPTCGQPVKNIDLNTYIKRKEFLTLRMKRLSLIKDKKYEVLTNIRNEISELKLRKQEETHIEEKRNVINEKIKDLQALRNKKNNLIPVKEKLQKIELKYETLKTDLQEATSILDSYKEKLAKYESIQSELKYAENIVEQISISINNLKNEQNPHLFISLLNIDYNALEQATINYEKAKLIRDVWSEDGIRRSLVSNFVEFINTKINEYLKILGPSNTQIKFDSKFDETFFVGANEYEYENFSAGQIKKIDLAFLLMTYDLVSETNLLDTNIIVFDEIIDSSIDNYGASIFLKLIKDKLKDKYIYIITHNSDIKSSDTIDRIYTATLDLFSTLTVEEFN